MSGIEEQEDGDEIKRRMAREGPKIKKELDRPGKLMVSGVPKDINYTNEQLKTEFSAFGEVLEVNVIRKKSTGIPKGFAFVTFKNPTDAETATKQVEGKDIGGDNPLHCERAVIGFIKQSQIASTRKRVAMAGRGGSWMERGRGGGRGQPLLERGGGFRGMRGGGPSLRGGRGRGGGYGMGGEMDGYQGEEDYYGGGEYWEEEGYGGGYPERGRGGPRGHPPQRGMRGAPSGMRGRGGPPGPGREGYPSRGGAGVATASGRGGFPARGMARGAPMSERGGPVRKPLLPSPPDVRGGRGGARGRGYPPPSSREEYYAEEEVGYGEEYGTGEEYYEEDPYSNGAGYAEEDQYGVVDEGYYGLPEAPRPAPAPRGRGPATAQGAQRGRGGPGAPQLYRGGEPPSRGGGLSRGGGPALRGGGGGQSTRGSAAAGRGGPTRGVSSEAARRQPSQDHYGYPVEQAAGPPRQRPGPRQAGGYGEEYYGEEEVVPRDPYARPRAAAGGRGPTQGSARGAALRRAADPYADDPYGMYEGGDASHSGMYGEEAYADGYVGAPLASGRRGAAPSSQARSSAASRAHTAESGRYVDISEYIGQGSGGPASRYQDEYGRQAPSRDVPSEGRRPAASRRDDPYMEQRVAAETDAYVSYPSSSRMVAEP
ncbi:RNA-binding motif protein, x chromosome, partial [Plakobranchus ocellatus]